MTPQEILVNTALSQVGYDAASGKKNKYAQALDKIGWVYNGPKNGFDWCDVFVDWCFITSFGAETGVAMLYQPKKGTGAGCPFSAGFFKNNKAFYQTPNVGDQIFFGSSGDEYHTGIVYKVTSAYVYTVEGNTGGGSGHVQKKQYSRGNSNISGYGRPKWSLVKSTGGSAAQTKKGVTEIAKEVIAGKWGNGTARVNALKKAGYDAAAVQAEVNRLLSGRKGVTEIAKEVIAGKWGNGSARVNALKKAGYDAAAVQAEVNRLLSK